MIFTEIALEGVRCFRDQCRFTLKPGYNLLWGPNESGKTTLVDCIAILLDPTRQVPEEAGFPSWGPPGNSRTGLMITEGDQSFRVTRDFVNGLVNLSSLNPQTQKFDVVAQDHAQVEGFLRQQLRFPQISLWRRLFVFDKSDLPSGRAKVIVRQVAAAPPPGAPAPDAAFGQMPAGLVPGPAPVAPAAPAGYGMSPEEIKQRIETLKEQMDSAKSVEKAQYEIDGLESKLFDIENKTKDIRSMEGKIEQLTNSLKSLESFSDLPSDIVRRIEFFEEAQREHENQLYEIDTRLEKAKKDFNALTERKPFFQQQNFIIGAACILGGLIVHGALVPKYAAMKILPPLLIIAGLGLIFWILWNEFSDRIKEGDLHKELDSTEEERKEEIKKFDVEGSVVRRLMEEAGVEEAKELNNKLKEYNRRREMAQELDQKLKKSKEDANYDQLAGERKELEEKIAELNKVLTDAGGGGFSQDPADIQREIDALQYALDNPGASPPAAAPPPGAVPYAPGAPGAPPPIPGVPGVPPPMPGVPGAVPPAPMPPQQAAPPAMPGLTPTAHAGTGDYLGGDDGYLGGGTDYAMEDSQPGVPPSYSADPDQTVVTGPGAAGAGAGAEAPLAPEGGIDTMVDELWGAAEQMSGLDRSTLIMQIAERFNVYVQAFTGKRYGEGDLSSERTMSLRTSAGSYTELKDLSPSTQDAAWLALKIAVIENLYQKFRYPVVLDDPLRNLDDARLAMVSKALKRIGAACQVLLFSTQRAHSKVADHTINIAPSG